MSKAPFLLHSLSFTLLLFFTCIAFAEDCQHLASERSRLYQRSSFAHGYIHGYEQGFHIGNQDLQLARSPRDIRKSDEYRAAGGEHQADTGRRNAFRAGYREGLIIGYTDASSGHHFRAIDEGRIATSRLDPPVTAVQQHHRAGNDFELGFMDGYRSGTIQGVEDGKNGANYRPHNATCSSHDSTSLGESFCPGYLRGFSFGYSDGYINHDELVVLANRKAGHTTVVAAAKK